MTSEILYQNRLQAPQEVMDRKLSLRKGPTGLHREAIDPSNTLVYMQVHGDETELGWSFDNHNQARVVTKLCSEFIGLGVDPAKISVIAAYSPHIRTINILLKGTGIQCKTVHKWAHFMGGENDIIIFATTRSNPTRDLGFVTQPEILNVATSRQLRKLIVVGDNAETSSEGSPTSKRMFDFIAAKASMLSINEH
jgi:superfamily I DNA and/or RNA helicase